MPERPRPRRIILVGLSGAGKSTVGPLVAAKLGWRFVDLDREIEQREGRSVAELFATEGEARFRELEREATRRLEGVDDVVLAPGSGWITEPSNERTLGGGNLTVYLRVSPQVAVSRLRGADEIRPLLAGPDPEGSLARLLVAREARYLQANHTLNVDSMAPAEIAHLIVALATDTRAD